MGLEVRRTPVGWMPPKRKVQRFLGSDTVERFQPQHDYTLAEGIEMYEDEKAGWRARRDEIIERHSLEFFEDGVAEYEADSPTIASDGTSYVPYYRPDWSADEMNGYQLYETITEGTPLTPSFATKEELIDHLERCGQGWESGQVERMDREDAEALVNMGSSIGSFVIIAARPTTATGEGEGERHD